MSLFSFQGAVHIGERSAAGKLLKPVFAGNVPALTLELATQSTPKNESYTGSRLQIGLLQGGKTANLSLTFDQWLPSTMALALYGEKLSTASGTVTGEQLPAGVVAGDVVKLDNPFISALTIVDSTGTPVAVPHTIESANAGLIKIGNLTGKTAPYLCAYEYAARESFAMFTKTPTEKYLFLDGINTETQEPVLAYMYRVRFNPVGSLALINEEYGNLPMTGAVLYDAINATNDEFGGFARFENKAAV